MRLATIGTSNTLIRWGSRAFLEAAEVARVASFALGGAPNVILPYMLARLDPTRHEAVVLDTLVNDMWNISAGDFTMDQACRILDETLAYLAGHGLRTVLLLLPTNDPSMDHVCLRSWYHAIAERHGAVVVDGYELLEALLEAGLDRRQVFLDAGHFRPNAALMTAKRVADALTAPAPVAAAPAGYPYSVHHLAAENLPSVERATSLMRGRYARIGAGQTIRFRFDDPRALVALALNEAATSAFVEIDSGAERLVKDLRLAAPNETALRHCLAPFRQPLAGREITLRVLTEAEAADQALDGSSHARPGPAAGVLELEAIVTRNAMAASPLPPAQPATLRPTPPLGPWERALVRLIRTTALPADGLRSGSPLPRAVRDEPGLRRRRGGGSAARYRPPGDGSGRAECRPQSAGSGAAAAPERPLYPPVAARTGLKQRCGAAAWVVTALPGAIVRARVAAGCSGGISRTAVLTVLKMDACLGHW